MGTPRSRGALTKSRKEAEGKLVYRLINDDLLYAESPLVVVAAIQRMWLYTAASDCKESVRLLGIGMNNCFSQHWSMHVSHGSVPYELYLGFIVVVSYTTNSRPCLFSALSQPIWLHCNPSPHPSPRTLSSRLGFPRFLPFTSCSQFRSGCWTLLPRRHIPFVSKSRRIWQEIVYYG